MLLIDTYNVLHVVGVLPPEMAGIETDGLVDLLMKSRYRNESIILVCDGVPGPHIAHAEFPVRVIYSGHTRTADDVIVRLVHDSSAPRRLRVVSSDRAVLREARRRRCSIISSEMLLRQLADDARLATTKSAPTAPPPVDHRDLIPDEVIHEARELETTLALPPIEAPLQDGEEEQEEDVLVEEPAPVEEDQPGDTFPDSILREAERWEADHRAAIDEPEASVDHAPKPKRAKKTPPPRNDILPGEIIREAESMLEDDDTLESS